MLRATSANVDHTNLFLRHLSYLHHTFRTTRFRRWWENVRSCVLPVSGLVLLFLLDPQTPDARQVTLSIRLGPGYRFYAMDNSTVIAYLVLKSLFGGCG